jgi:hypothetical protein
MSTKDSQTGGKFPPINALVTEIEIDFANILRSQIRGHHAVPANSRPVQPFQIGRRQMWQPDIKFGTGSYPAGGVAPSTCALAPHNHIQKANYPAGGVAPSTYALALHNYIQKARARLRR